MVDGAVPTMGRRLRGGATYSAIINYSYLQNYVLCCCQQEDGGLRDKPSKNRDFYHTCYCLSGLSIAQHASGEIPSVTGDIGNLIGDTDPIFNVRKDMVLRSVRYFSSLPSAHEALSL